MTAATAACTVLAIDLGAESGRVMAVAWDGEHLSVEELHRFPNGPVEVRGTLFWDFLYLWQEIQRGIEKGRALGPASLGVDTWGVDFALLDATGHLVGNPVHYRDARTQGVMERVLERIPRETIFAQTGVQFLPINTLYQLMSLVEAGAPPLAIAETFLMAPDLIHCWLTGAQVCEFTNATTTQLFNPQQGTWAVELMETLGIPARIFPEIVPPGTRLGAYRDIPVIAPATHDTASAVAAVPAREPGFAYISSGTWSLVGLEVPEPILSPGALAANATNEGGVEGTYRFLRNLMGLWIVQQCRRAWAREGYTYTYEELTEMAAAAPPFRCVIDPDDGRFLPPGDHPRLIQEMAWETGQPVPETPGQVIRCVLESLALSYRETLTRLAQVADQPIHTVHIVGGGSRNALLNQMTADATGWPVVAGPAEATVIGNALVQLKALGELSSVAEGRGRVATLPELRTYEPRPSPAWEDLYARYKALPTRTPPSA